MTTPTFRLMMHDQAYKSKTAAAKHAGVISSNILNNPVSMDIQEIADHILKGHTFMMAEMRHTKEDKQRLQDDPTTKIPATARHWVSQQLFAIDIDNEYYDRDLQQSVKATGDMYLTLSSIQTICQERGILPVLIYETFSSTKTHFKCRVVFAMDRVVKTEEERQRIMQSLVQCFYINNNLLIDVKCINAARMFFAGKAISYINPGVLNQVDDVLAIPITYVRTKPSKRSITPQTLAVLESKDIPFISYLINNEWYKAQLHMNRFHSDWLSLTPPRDTAIQPKGGTYYLKYILKDICPPIWTNSGNPWAARDSSVLIDFVHHFPMHLFFEKALGEPFSCILGDHQDNKPSANFYRTDEGKYLYICHGCTHNGKTTVMDFFDLVMHFTGFSFKKAFDQIIKLFNMTVETEWQARSRQHLYEWQQLFLNPERLQEIAPLLYKYLKRSNMLGFLGVLMSEASVYLLDKDVTERDCILYSTPIRLFAEKLKRLSIRGADKDKVHRKLHIASVIGLLQHLPDSDDSYVVNRAKLAQINRNRVEGLMNQYRTNVYQIPWFSIEHILYVEDRVKQITEMGFKNSVADMRQAYVWLMSKQEVDQHFVQDSNRNEKSEETQKAFDKLLGAAESLLTKNGFFTKKDLLSHPAIRKMKQREKLLNIVLPELLKTLALVNTYYSKHYAEKFAISQQKKKSLYAGRTIIFVKQSDKK